MNNEEKTKYYELCCNHTAIDRPVKTFQRIDDYPFMEHVEKMLGIAPNEVGDFRATVCQWKLEEWVLVNTIEI